MKLYLEYTFFLFFVLMIAFSVNTLADENEIVCLKSDRIRSVDFKKDYMIFEMQKRESSPTLKILQSVLKKLKRGWMLHML